MIDPQSIPPNGGEQVEFFGVCNCWLKSIIFYKNLVFLRPVFPGNSSDGVYKSVK